jgi:pSer/pThr/pTyr-binding forkhead associated (FHA) protein
MATNGIRINGDDVHTARLHDGDVVRLGRVSLVFKEIPASEASRPWLRRLQIALLIGSLLLAVGLVLLV